MKLKNILFIAIAILTIGLFVACNDEVVATKDNNLAYTQVLESNGAFEYAGTKYDTLQLAFKAIADGKGFSDIKTIKVLRDVTGPGASISADKAIVLDLDGHTLTFIDVEKEALTAGDSVNLIVKNGTLAFFKDSAKYSLDYDRTLILAQDAKSLSLDGVTLNAAGQNAVVAVDTGVVVKGGSVLSGDVLITGESLSITGNSTLDGALDVTDSHVTLGASDEETENSTITGEIKLTGSSANPASFNAHKNTLVTGKMTATGTSSSSDVIITVNNEVGPVYMEYGTITVNEFGHATMGLVDTGNLHNEYVVTTTGVDPYNAITLPEGSTVVINTGICVVAQATGSTYYGSIHEALQDANAGLTIVLLADDAEGLDSSLTIPYNITIDLAGKNLTSAISNAYNLTVKSSAAKSTLTGTLTGTGDAAEFVVDNVTVTGAVSGASSLVASKATFNDTVTVTGALTSDGSTFEKAVSAASVKDGDSTASPALVGSTFKDNVTVTGALVSYMSAFSATEAEKTISGNTLSISSSTFDSYNEKNYVLTASGADSTGKAISITSTTGCVKSLTATAGSITVDNRNSSSYQLWILNHVNAKSSTDQYYDVTVVANSNQEYSIRLGGQINAKDFVADYVKFLNSSNITASTVRVSNSDFVNNSGTRSITASGTDYKVGTVDHATLEITNTKGSVGSLTANGGGSIKVDNSGAADTLTVTGNVSASKTASETTTYYDVTLIGKNDGSKNVIVNGTIIGNDITLDRVTANGNVTAKDVADDTTTTAVDETDNGSITATNSTFTPSTGSNKELKGNTISVSNSTFNATDSYHYALEATGADYSSTSALTITTTTGSVASLTATAGSIKVANGSASATLTVTGNVLAKSNEDTPTYYDVTLVGNANVTGDTPVVKNVVVNGTIDGNDIVLNFATVNGNVTAHDNAAVAPAADLGSVVATSSTFDTLNAASKTISGSTLSFTTSTFTVQDNVYALEATGADYGETTPKTSALLITTSTGTVKSLTATAGSINVDNSEADTALTVTGNVLAKNNEDTPTYYDVTLVGKSGANVVVNGAISGNDISLTHATVNNSVFAIDNTAEAPEVADLGSVVATNSVFTPLSDVESDRTVRGNTVSVSSSEVNVNNGYRYNFMATGTDYSVETVAHSALEITNSIGSVGSLTATAGSINVANSGASATLTVTGNIFAVTSDSPYTYYDVKLVGNSSHKVTVNGHIYGDDFNANYVTFKAPAGYNKEVRSKTATISNSNFDASNSSYYYFNARGYYEEGTYEDYAIVVLNTSGTLNSLTATAGHIGVDNYHEATVTSSLTILDDVSATDGDYYYDVVLAGNDSALVVVRGDIYGDSVSFEYKTESDGDVIANTSFSAKYSIVGDNTVYDTVFSPAIEISNSKIVLYRLAASATESADTVTITSPVEGSAIADIATDKLDVTADDANLVVDNVSITGTSTINIIAGGTYKALTFRGEGVVSSILTITKGQFFNPGSTSGSEDDTAGVFVFNTGTTRIAGTYSGTATAEDQKNPAKYSVFIWGLDNMNSTTSIECAYVQSSKLSGLSGIVAKVNQTLSSQRIYINYDPYHEETDHMVEISSGAPEYPLYTSGTVYNVVLNFAYTGGTGDYSIESGLFVTNTAMPNLNFGTNNITVTGRVFVTGEASVYSTLYSNDFVYLATAPTSSTHEWIVALPAEAEYGQFKYKAASMTLSVGKLLVAKNRILVGTSTVGTNVADTTTSYSFKQYHYNSNSSISETIYCAKNTVYDVAHLSASSASIADPASYDKIYSWGPNVVNKFYTLAGGSTTEVSGTIIWTKQQYGTTSNEYCYGYSGATLCWHDGDCPSTGHHIIVDIDGYTF